MLLLGLYVLLTLIGCFGLVLSSGGIYLFMMIVFGIQVFTSGYLSQHHNNELIKKEKNWVIFSMII